MECFGQYRSDNPKCIDCWLRDCCKLARARSEEKYLTAIKSGGLTIRQFDGEDLRQKSIGYDKSLLEFLKPDQQLCKETISFGLAQ